MIDLTDDQRAALPSATVYAAVCEWEGTTPAGRAFGRWHVLPDGETVIYERRLGELEVAQVLAASTLASSPSWVQVPE